MDYANFSISFPVMLVAVPLTVMVGIITLVLARRKKRLLALLVGISSVLLIAGWVLASGYIETARTNAMLRVADQLAVPEGFDSGQAEDFRGKEWSARPPSCRAWLLLPTARPCTASGPAPNSSN